MRDSEIAQLGFYFLLGILFLPWILGFVFPDDIQEEDCDLEWVECDEDDKFGDCIMFNETNTIGPYWNETTVTTIEWRKKICK